MSCELTLAVGSQIARSLGVGKEIKDLIDMNPTTSPDFMDYVADEVGIQCANATPFISCENCCSLAYNQITPTTIPAPPAPTPTTITTTSTTNRTGGIIDNNKCNPGNENEEKKYTPRRNAGGCKGGCGGSGWRPMPDNPWRVNPEPAQ